jgi:plastocyanin
MPFKFLSKAPVAAMTVMATMAMTSCGGSGSSSAPVTTPTVTPPTTAPSVTVNIVGSSGNTAFAPNPVMVNAGDTLIFKNVDAAMHHIVMNDGSADLGDIVPGASKSITAKAAVSNFHCTIHSTMIGSINGSAPPEPPPCTTPGYCD